MIKNFNEVKLQWEDKLNALCSRGFLQFFALRTEEVFNKWYDSINHDADEKIEGIIFQMGASKLVLLDDDNDWVLKIPFSDTVHDHCKVEVTNYKNAVKEGVEEPFAACCFLTEYENAPCYIMEKVCCDEDTVTSDLYNRSREKLSDKMDEEEICDYLNSIDAEYIYMELLPAYYSEKFLQRLHDFIWRYGIEDLHTGNLGYRDDKLVFIDYSGYAG